MQFWADGPRSNEIATYIFAHASPLWRGAELFATSVDLVHLPSNLHTRTLLPIVCLDRGLFDAVGNTLAVIWQLLLVAGPSWTHMRYKCRRVRAIVSDLGVERNICNMPAMLKDFFDLIGAPVSQRELDVEPEGDYLVERCLQVPGWKHAIDVMLQRCCTSLRWFPRWLDQFKSVVSVLRRSVYKAAAPIFFRKDGLPALAEVVESLSLP